jgi:hypothetical protein
MLSHNNNRYNFIPDTRITTTGTINQVLRLTVYFDGNQRDYFYNTMGGLAWRVTPNNRLSLKLMASAWQDARIRELQHNRRILPRRN